MLLEKYIDKKIEQFDQHNRDYIGMIYMLLSTIINSIYLLIVKLTWIPAFHMIFYS